MDTQEAPKKITRQVTLFLPSDLLEQADDAAVRAFRVRNGRTRWIREAMEDKLARQERMEAGIADDHEGADEERIREIIQAYNVAGEEARVWLHIAACLIRDNGGSLPA